MELFAFKTAEEYLGIEAQFIHRVVDDVQITPVPLVPSCHMGLIYYRGEVFDVIHVGSLLGQKEAVYNENSRIIFLKWSHKKLALVPDHIIGFIWIKDTKGEKTFYTPRPPRLSPTEQDDPPATARHERAGGGQKEKYTVRLITPDYIWKKVSGLSYGPYKV